MIISRKGLRSELLGNSVLTRGLINTYFISRIGGVDVMIEFSPEGNPVYVETWKKVSESKEGFDNNTTTMEG